MGQGSRMEVGVSGAASVVWCVAVALRKRCGGVAVKDLVDGVGGAVAFVAAAKGVGRLLAVAAKNIGRRRGDGGRRRRLDSGVW